MNLRSLLARRAPPAKIALEDASSSAPTERFFERAESLDASARVLEVGTKQSVPGKASHTYAAFPNVPRGNYVMIDIEGGADVDVVADLHALPHDWTERFDAFVAVAVFEHLERPWIAAGEVARVLKPGGLCFISTHQTFPLHGYPSDYYRFSKEALCLLFADVGIRALEASYEHRTRIIPPSTEMMADDIERWNAAWPSYLCVHLFGTKTGGA